MNGGVHWIDGAAALESLGERLRRADAIGLDTEQDSFFAYRPKICIVQIAALGEEFIVDALALRDFSPLQPALADPDVPKILHAGDNDVDLLRRDCGLEIRGLFDTMAAAAILGYPRVGLAALIELHLGEKLEKKWQRSDWRRRPLARPQIEYAALDVRHLAALRAILAAELESTRREEEAACDFRRIERVRHEQRVIVPDDYWRIDASRRLDGVGRRVMRDLFAWRDELARAGDRAPFRVIGDESLLALARERPGRPALDDFPGLSDRIRHRHLDEIARLIARAVEQGELRPPESPRPPPVQRLDERQSKLFEQLRRWRSRRAKRRGVDAGRVVPNALLLQVALTQPRAAADLERLGFERWRIVEYGADVLALIAGRPQPD